MPSFTVARLAELCEGKVDGDPQRVIGGANTLENADETEVAFAANRKAVDSVSKSRAGCILAPLTFEQIGPWSLIRVPDPRSAFARLLSQLYPVPKRSPSIHPTAVIASTAKIAPTAYIGAFVTVGEGTTVGEGCQLGEHCAIGEDVSIGAGSTLRPHVTVYDRVKVGARALLHSGCVLGADGFGFAFAGDHYDKFPQVGSVEIGDDVEIGANSCVDRAALGVTRIGDGTKLDNMVHIAHNCQIGRHVVIAAQTGFSGGVTVGDYAVVGGQVGAGDKAVIDSRAVVGSGSGILTAARVSAGEPVWGVPARPLRQHLKGLAYVNRLPKIHEELKDLRTRITALEGK
jgi:UDP-3-O-[3-hydroxymyristoyl] glucosamine N-acyltransferase